jgi:hypothetical protein
VPAYFFPRFSTVSTFVISLSHHLRSACDAVMVTRPVLLIATLALVACREQHPAEKHTRILWKPVGSWSGHGNTQTDSFEMEAGNWRVKWETHNPKDPKAGEFRVAVHSAISGRPLETAVEHRGDGRDIAYVDEDPRVFFLVIDSKDLDWSVTVEERLVAETAGPGSPQG